jgi:alkylation response protein AidB-like acyl-CoA dehydrogenase
MSADTVPAVQRALAQVAAGAAARDREPAFPFDAMAVLARAGALGRCGSISQEWELVRAVAQADGSVGRIVDGHYNAVERIELLADEPLRNTHLEEVAAGRRWLGVWGADPAPGEGEPAHVARDGGELRLEGVKTFCSGAGGLDGALVVARDGDARRVAYVDLSEGVEVDRSWFAAAGMRASESHLVRFHGARVHALLGGPDELLRDPWFGRDAIRTAATWAGIADAARAAALDSLAPRALAGDDLAALAVGRIDTHAQTIDLWLAEAGRRADAHPDAAMRTLSVHLREAVARAAQALVDEALRAAGSRPLAHGGALDRAARDLRIFLLQHRLDPLLVRAGREAVDR